MQMSQNDLIAILERSSSLSERLSGSFAPVKGDSATIRRRLTRWKQVAASNRSQAQHFILNTPSVQEHDEATLLSILGEVRRVQGVDLPEWMPFIGEVAQAVAKTFGTAAGVRKINERADRIVANIPYGHLYEPIAELAKLCVTNEHCFPESAISNRAWRGLQRYLIRRIDSIASLAVHTVFQAHRSFRASGMVGYFASSRSDFETKIEHGGLYENFVIEHGQEGMRRIFMRFPVVARLISEVTLLWIAFAKEFLHRLACDREEVAAHFNRDAPIGGVSDIKAGVSDPHRGGRSVLILTFENGSRLVYKPHPLEVDAVFFDLVQTVNTQTHGPNLHALKVLNRSEYGWMEFAHHAPCVKRRDASRFYHRAGSLVCLVHWLQGIDFHRENVVARGECPVLIDFECLAHPLSPAEKSSIGDQFFWAFANSVLRTGLLPLRQQRFRGSAPFDSSGLGAPISQQSLLPVPRFVYVNTDRMHWTLEKKREFRSSHRVKLNGRLVALRDFETAVVAGYRQTAKLTEGQAAGELAEWRKRICETQRRFIKRPTIVYAMLLRRSVQPENLTSGIDRSIELQLLPVDRESEGDRDEEIRSLENLDVPYFHIAREAGCGDLVQRAPSAPENLPKQEKLIRLSLRGRLLFEDGKLRPLQVNRKSPT